MSSSPMSGNGKATPRKFSSPLRIYNVMVRADDRIKIAPAKRAPNTTGIVVSSIAIGNKEKRAWKPRLYPIESPGTRRIYNRIHR